MFVPWNPIPWYICWKWKTANESIHVVDCPTQLKLVFMLLYLYLSQKEYEIDTVEQKATAQGNLLPSEICLIQNKDFPLCSRNRSRMMINIGVGPGSLSQLLDTITIAGRTLNFKLSCNGKLSGIIIARATLHYHKHYPTIFALSKTT